MSLPDVTLEARRIQTDTAAHYGFTLEQLLGRDRHEPLAAVRMRCILIVARAFDGRLTREQIGELFHRHHSLVCYVVNGHAKGVDIDRRPTCNCGRIAAQKLPCGHWACARCATEPHE